MGEPDMAPLFFDPDPHFFRHNNPPGQPGYLTRLAACKTTLHSKLFISRQLVYKSCNFIMLPLVAEMFVRKAG
jgi:hypothetical protein